MAGATLRQSCKKKATPKAVSASSAKAADVAAKVAAMAVTETQDGVVEALPKRTKTRARKAASSASASASAKAQKLSAEMDALSALAPLTESESTQTRKSAKSAKAAKPAKTSVAQKETQSSKPAVQTKSNAQTVFDVQTLSADEMLSPDHSRRGGKLFALESPFEPAGDQGDAIDKLVAGLKAGNKGQTLLGVTGSGKTFTMANVIARLNRPTMILSHNKTLAAQLYGEMKEFFPHNAVEYFVSYYDYYQPEAYVAATDTYIEKDASVNEQIDQMRLSATKALMERRDTIVVCSVSAIYGLGEPETYLKMMLHISRGEQITPQQIINRLATLQYTRNDVAFERSTFRVRGDVIDIFPSESDGFAIRVELFDDEIERISRFDPLTVPVEC